MSAVTVADVAVSMGPRNKRRLATAGSVLIALAAIVVAVWVMSAQTGSNGPGSAGSSQSLSSSTEHPLAFGSSEQTVRRIAGRPMATRGNCWLYRPKAGMVGAIPMGQPGSNAFKTADSLKLCFFGGLSSALEHVRTEGGIWSWISIAPTYIKR